MPSEVRLIQSSRSCVVRREPTFSPPFKSYSTAKTRPYFSALARIVCSSCRNEEFCERILKRRPALSRAHHSKVRVVDRVGKEALHYTVTVVGRLGLNLRNGLPNTPSSPFSRIQRKCVSTTPSHVEVYSCATLPFGNVRPVSKRHSGGNCETSGQVSMRTATSNSGHGAQENVGRAYWCWALARFRPSTSGCCSTASRQDDGTSLGSRTPACLSSSTHRLFALARAQLQLIAVIRQQYNGEAVGRRTCCEE